MAAETGSGGENVSATALRDCRHGRFLYLREDIYIGRSLELYGEYCEGEARLFAQLVGQGHVVVEAGANIGSHTVHLAKLVGPGGQVLAFEPQRIVHTILCANLALNEQFHAQAIRAAVGSAKGTIKVPVLDPHGKLNFGAMSLPMATDGEAVPVVVLDEYELPSLRLLKIDVEGMEIEVLRGAAQTVKRHRPFLYVENDREKNSVELIGLIMEMGYKLFWHLPFLFNPNNFFGHAENVFGGVASINMLCVPAEIAAKITGFRPITSPNDHWRAAASR